MTLQEIKDAVRAGKKVHWVNGNYDVIVDDLGQWLVHSKKNDFYTGLVERVSGEMQAEEKDFYIEQELVEA